MGVGARGRQLGPAPNWEGSRLVAGTREFMAVLPYSVIYESKLRAELRILHVWYGARNRNG